VGSGYGAVPDGPSQKSVVELQNQLAIQRSKDAALKRLIWLREGTASEHSDQRRFIEALQRDPKAQFGADLITGDGETFKTAVRACLDNLERRAPVPAATDNAHSANLVYLICDEKDRSATIPVRKFLRTAGLEVRIPVFEGDAATVRQANQDGLMQCDAVMIFYGAGGEAWKRTVESDLKKLKGYRSDKPLQATFTYLAEPATPDKIELIELEEPNIIDGMKGLPEKDLQRFLAPLQKARAV
jgi:hypothetical protein